MHNNLVKQLHNYIQNAKVISFSFILVNRKKIIFFAKDFFCELLTHLNLIVTLHIPPPPKKYLRKFSKILILYYLFIPRFDP